MSQILMPGATLGMLGGGQLGRMFAIAARQMGYRVKVFTDEPGSPGVQLADEHHVLDFNQPDQLRNAMTGVDVVTFETENLPLKLAHRAAQFAPVHPGTELLRLSQHRWIEKTSLRGFGLPVGDFKAVRSVDDLQRALADFDQNGVLKTTVGGYDGKGQWMIRTPEQAKIASEAVTRVLQQNASPNDEANRKNEEPPPCHLLLEDLIDFELEFSMVAARGHSGDFVTYGPILNHHHDHILDVSACPADLGEKVDQQSREIVRSLAEQLDTVGLFCVEFFLTRNGEILINEVAPRTHNSGHLTIESHTTSQFAQQVRAICGMTLGCSQQLKPAAMVNLLGDLWLDQTPAWDAALAIPGTSLHLYGKQVPRSKRKMGHITVVADDVDTAVERARAARTALTN